MQRSIQHLGEFLGYITDTCMLAETYRTPGLKFLFCVSTLGGHSGILVCWLLLLYFLLNDFLVNIFSVYYMSLTQASGKVRIHF